MFQFPPRSKLSFLLVSTSETNAHDFIQYLAMKSSPSLRALACSFLNIFGSSRKSAIDLIGDERGTTAIIFGLFFLPSFLMLGSVIDYTRVAVMKSNLQQSADGATLWVASKMTFETTLDQAREKAEVFLKTKPGQSMVEVTEASLTNNNQKFCITAENTTQSVIMKLVGINNLTARVASCAAPAGSPDDLEIALVVDNSGSMGSSAGGGVTKIQALKTAATNFVNLLFSQTGETDKVKLSIVPFNAAVRAVDPSVSSNRTASWVDTAGNSSVHWRAFGGKAAASAAGFANRFDIFDRLRTRHAQWDWNGCFDTQPYPMNVNDTPPNSSAPDTLLVPHLVPDDPDGFYRTSDGSYFGPTSGGGTFSYSNNYLTNDNPTTGCTGAVSQWDRMTKVCKYAIGPGASTSGVLAAPNGHCSANASQTLMRLSSDKIALNNKINSLIASGNTNIYEGAIWGWRTISPNAPFADGKAYGHQKLRKIMIIMTDGDNVWNARPRTVGGSEYQPQGFYSFNGQKNTTLPNGSAGNGVDYQTQLAPSAPNNSSSSFTNVSRAAQDEMTAQTCANAKARDIEIFTIGFSTGGSPISPAGLALMKGCATNDAHYFKVENASQLNDAFAAIGLGVSKLRLTN